MHPAFLPSRLRLALGLLLAFCSSALAQVLPEPGPVIAEVLATHPAVRRAQLELEAAEATLGGSRLQPNPTLSLVATAGDAQDFSTLSQTLEISGQPRLRHEQAQARVEAARLQLKSARRKVAGLVYSGWVDLWETQNLAALAQLRMDLMTEMTRVTRRRFEVGEIPQNESLRVELASAEAESELRKAQAAYAAAARSLSVLRGLVDPQTDAPTLSSINPPTMPGPRLLLGESPPTLEEVLASAGDQLEVEAMRREQKATTLEAELIAKERAPQLSFSLYRADLFPSEIQQGAQISLSWPVFDWGSVDARKKAQLLHAQAQLAEVEEKALGMRREVAELWNQWQAAQSVRDILQTQAQRYEELARESRIGYDLGMLSLTDVLQTESAFRQAGVQLIQAQAEISRLELSLLERTNLPWPSQLLEEQ